VSRQLTLLRHSGGVRLAHLLFAAAIAWLILSGLGVHESLSAGMIHALGGHVLLVTSHRWLGYTLGAAALLALNFLQRRLREFLAAIVGFQRADVAWLPGLLRALPRPRKTTLPWHAGRFDPGQRLVFLILISSLALLVATGVALNFIPSNARMVFAWTLRMHLAVAWVCIGAIGVHVFAGLGVLPTHRGVTRAMFGDGRVSVELSRRLWPGWTARQPGAGVRKPTATTPATTKLP
jgi:formate dehydrogenase subunit gamma